MNNCKIEVTNKTMSELLRFPMDDKIIFVSSAGYEERMVGLEKTLNKVMKTRHKITDLNVIRGDKKIFDEDGKFIKIEKNVDKEVEATFSDGIVINTVCSDKDDFDLETGLTVCMAKKLCGGTHEYNKQLQSAIKMFEGKLAAQDKAAREEAAIKRKTAKKARKRAEWKARKAAAAREEAIAIQTEAYLRAIKIIEKED